ncbi:OmpA family protein [Vibrio sagamiensis]|uniref:Outer membrane protein A n=1 Tax=Vibrio sagamiensis NBRC 104589 TaxID=1219064 RepID=A0A511QIH7_9VIBR|nr:OmpA family protein [Vibrio sagamiensis]PNQ53830.1 hypothetical protein C1141_19145 [Vibrio agarivorans]GEM77103.1 outer membrane protein A [Vibrio sagamiensis NBRC 104589]
MSNLYPSLPLSLILSGLGLSAYAQSVEDTVFLGLKAGYQFSQDDAYRHGEDPKGGIVGLFAGYQFTPSWAFEAGYQYHAELHASATSVDVKTSLIDVAVRYDWYWQELSSIYGRLGFAYWDMAKHSPSFKEDTTGFSPLGEIGLAYQFTPQFKASMGYQYIDDIGDKKTGYYDSHSFIWSLSYVFTSKNATDSEKATMRPIKETANKKNNSDAITYSPEVCNFEFNSSALSESCQSVLIETAEELSSSPHANASVVGHTDSTGSIKVNQVLSERRADAAANFLENHGVSSNQLHVEGKGEHAPIASNDTAEGRALNRRVEIDNQLEAKNNK